MSDTQPLHRRHVMVAVGSALTATVGQFQFLSVSLVNPPLARSLGADLSEVMGYNSLMAVASVIAIAALNPYLYRRFGVRWLMIVGGFVATGATAAVVLVRSVAVLYALGFITGLAFSGIAFMAASMLINQWFETNRGAIMGGAFAFAGLGGVAAGLILPGVVKAGGWEAGFLSVAGTILVLTVGSAVFLIRSRPEDVGLKPFGAPLHAERGVDVSEVVLPGIPARQAYASWPFWALILGMTLFGAIQAVQQHFAPLMSERGVSLLAAGSLLSVLALATVATNIVLGVVADRRGTAAILVIAIAGQFISMLGFAFVSGYLALATSTVIFAFSAAFAGVFTPLIVLRLFGARDFGDILGPASAAIPAGIAVGAPLWGVVQEQTSSYTPMLIASAIATLLIGVILGFTERRGATLRGRGDA